MEWIVVPPSYLLNSLVNHFFAFWSVIYSMFLILFFPYDANFDGAYALFFSAFYLVVADANFDCCQ